MLNYQRVYVLLGPLWSLCANSDFLGKKWWSIGKKGWYWRVYNFGSMFGTPLFMIWYVCWWLVLFMCQIVTVDPIRFLIPGMSHPARWQSPTEALAGPLRCHLPEKQLGCIDIEHQSIIVHPWPWWDTFAVLLLWWYRDPRSLEASLVINLLLWLGQIQTMVEYIWRNKNDLTATSLEWWSVRVINYPNLTLPSYFRSVSCSNLSR
jgi:hypothetical protein